MNILVIRVISVGAPGWLGPGPRVPVLGAFAFTVTPGGGGRGRGGA